MTGFTQYPTRVTRLDSGVYVWRHAIGKEYERRSYKSTMTACGIIALFVALYGGWLSFINHDRQSMWIWLACDAIFLLIAGLICFVLDRLPGEMSETYEMTDAYVKPGSWKGAQHFSFKDANEVVVTSGYIELKGKVRRLRIFVPEGDMGLVKGHILARVPEVVQIRYE